MSTTQGGRSSRRSGRSSRGKQPAEDLFKTHTVAQVRVIEAEMEQKITTKQEELKQLVGARYRDLIEAADSIVEMRDLAVHSGERVAAVQGTTDRVLERLASERPGGGEAAPEREEKETSYAVAVQLKLLVDAPERMWAALEAGDLLSAVQQFIFTENIYGNLRGTPAHARLLSSFPVLQRQWSTISQFPRQILRAAGRVLGQEGLAGEQYGAALCAHALLGELDAARLLDCLLSSRTASIRAVLQSLPHVRPEEAMPRVVRLVASTVKDVHALFLERAPRHLALPLNRGGKAPPGGAPGGRPRALIAAMLALFDDASPSPEVFSQRLTALMGNSTSSMLLFLPAAAQAFSRLSTAPRAGEGAAATPEPFENAAVRAVAAAWMEGMSALLASEGAEAVGAMCAARPVGGKCGALARAREAVWREIQATTTEEGGGGGGGGAARRGWSVTCLETLGADVKLWGLFRVAFHGPAAAAASETLRALSLVVPITKILDGGVLDGDVARFTWTPEVDESGDTTIVGGDTLARKARGLTDGVHGVLQALDEASSQVVQDVAQLKHEGETVRALLPPSFALDLDELLHQLRAEAVAALAGMGEAVDALRRERAAAGGEDMEAALLLSRCLSAAARHSPALPRIFAHLQPPRAATPARRAAAALPAASHRDLGEVRRGLLGHAAAAYEVWARAAAGRLVAQLVAGLEGGDWSSRGRQSGWPEVPGPDGTPLRLPVQASPNVTSFLFAACAEVLRSGGHTTPASIVDLFVNRCAGAALEAYITFVSKQDNISSVGACQLLFDLRFTMAVLASRGRTDEKVHTERTSLALDAIGKHVDAVDLVLFGPAIQSHALRLRSSSALLFGLLSRGGEGEVSEAFEASPLVCAPVTTRLPHLPVTMPDVRVQAQAKADREAARQLLLEGGGSTPTRITAAMDGQAGGESPGFFADRGWSFVSSMKKNVNTATSATYNYIW